MLEEEVKNKVAREYFSDFDTTKIIGKIDFCVAKLLDRSRGRQGNLDLGSDSENVLSPIQSFLWAEAKQGE